jgi:uncharacterized membrane protein HdeD (DUF308 family)
MPEEIIYCIITVIGISLLIAGVIYFRSAKVKKKVQKFLDKFSCCG